MDDGQLLIEMCSLCALSTHINIQQLNLHMHCSIVSVFEVSLLITLNNHIWKQQKLQPVTHSQFSCERLIELIYVYVHDFLPANSNRDFVTVSYIKVK